MKAIIGIFVFFVASCPHADAQNASDFFRKHLSDCPQNEVRCLYFLHEKVSIAMLMTIKLTDSTVNTVREVFDWALQDSETRGLSHAQIEKIKEIISDLPPNQKDVPFEKSLFIAFRQGEKTEIYQYERRKPPSVIDRLYNIGGGYLDDEDRNSKSGAEKNALPPTSQLKSFLSAIENDSMDKLVVETNDYFRTVVKKNWAPFISQFSPRLKAGYSTAFVGQSKPGLEYYPFDQLRHHDGGDFYIWRLKFNDGGEDLLIKLNVENGQLKGWSVELR